MSIAWPNANQRQATLPHGALQAEEVRFLVAKPLDVALRNGLTKLSGFGFSAVCSFSRLAAGTQTRVVTSGQLCEQFCEQLFGKFFGAYFFANAEDDCNCTSLPPGCPSPGGVF